MDKWIQELENKSVYVLREVKARYKKPAILCSFGKDSTAMLYLAKTAFYGEIPFPVVHLDTSVKFPSMYTFRDELQKELGFELIVARNEEALSQGMNPAKGHLECCNALKTDALKQVVKKYGFDAICVGIRRDEHGVRAKEHYMSPRANDFKWRTSREALKGESCDSGLVSLSDPEFSGWDLYASDYDPETSHVRIHPLLHWAEEEIWRYLKEKHAKFNPMYLSKDGKRYRSLGCMPCTQPVTSMASNIDEIIQELKLTNVQERSGRAQDKEAAGGMAKLRALGYM